MKPVPPRIKTRTLDLLPPLMTPGSGSPSGYATSIVEVPWKTLKTPPERSTALGPADRSSGPQAGPTLDFGPRDV
ncbi:hypothetical protein [Sorangium sp. So ce128]|uniref:hypothetical protein n=1 Tax=Sorangium sp. So ce128 TaxID=3133281 RepID=UPI003F629D99